MQSNYKNNIARDGVTALYCRLSRDDGTESMVYAGEVSVRGIYGYV